MYGRRHLCFSSPPPRPSLERRVVEHRPLVNPRGLKLVLRHHLGAKGQDLENEAERRAGMRQGQGHTKGQKGKRLSSLGLLADIHYVDKLLLQKYLK